MTGVLALNPQNLIAPAVNGGTFGFSLDTSPVEILPINPQVQRLVFSNPGTGTVYVCQAFDENGNAQTPGPNPGNWLIAPGASFLFTGNGVAGAWLAVAAGGSGNPLTVSGLPGAVAPSIAPIPPPVQEFFFGVNLSGAESGFPVFVTYTGMKYWTDRGVLNFRIPFRWSIPNTTLGVDVGVQLDAFGALEDTSLSYPLQGTNLLYNSERLASSPWQTFTNGSGTISVTANAGVDPNGGNTATLIALNRADGFSQPVIFQNYVGAVPGTSTNSVYLKAATAFDLGRVVQMSLFADSSLSVIQITLTADWVRYSTTGTLPSAGRYAIEFGYLPVAGADIGPTNLLAWGAQANAGSLAPYQSTVAGYVQALDQIFINANALGARILLDCHCFGGGPGGLTVGDPGLPPSALGDMWGKVVSKYIHHPSFYAIEPMNEWVNGFDVSIAQAGDQSAVNAARVSGFAGPIHCDGVNFTGVWNWVDGLGQPFNNSNLYQITDPQNNIVFVGHGYFDNDSSGSNFAYAIEAAKSGAAPPGVPTSPTIGTFRLLRNWLGWLAGHALDGVYSEFGVSTDPVTLGGVWNWDAWIAIGRATIDLCKANNIPCYLWGNGPGFGAGPGGYGFNAEPYNPITQQKDYTATGVQSVLVAGFINHYVTNPQPEPTAYMLIGPTVITPTTNPEAPTVTLQVYGTVGTPSAPLTIIYGGNIASPVTITPHAKFSDGTDAGGSFTPSTIVLQPDTNALATYTYTPANVGTILLSTTNDAGWSDPAFYAISTQADAWKDLGVAPSPVFNMYLSYTPYIGPAIQIRNPTTGAVQNFAFTRGKNFDRVAMQAFAGQQSGIPVLARYDQTSGNPMTFAGTLPTLNLQNSDGYPEIDYTAASALFNFPVNNLTQMTVIARMKQGASGVGQGLFRMDQVTGPILWNATSFEVVNTGFIGNTHVGGEGVPTVFVDLGITASQWHEYAVTYSSGVTNGLISYVDGTLHASATCTYTLNASFGSTSVSFGAARFNGGNWNGADSALSFVPGVALSAGQLATALSYETDHYSTALPDTLPPIFVGVTNQSAISGTPIAAFSGITLQDAAGTSISVVFTLTGHPATLSGTGLTGSGPYTLTSDTVANINTKLQALQLSTTGTAGQVTNIAMVATSSTALTCSANPTATIINAANPIISGMVGPNVSKTQGAPALWQVTVADTNPTPTVSASITITGSGGTLSHVGPTAPSGTGPYTFAADTPANLTRWLRNLLWLPSVTTVGTTTTFTLTVTNNLGLTGSASNTITNVAPAAMPAALVPVATPGTLPRSYKGMGLSGGEFDPAIYQTSSATFAWPLSEGLDTIRLPFTVWHMMRDSGSGVSATASYFRNFNAPDLGAIQAGVELCRANGQFCVLDNHAFGSTTKPFQCGTTDDSSGVTWGTDIRVPKECYADFHQRLISYFQNYPNVLIELENEPGWLQANYFALINAAVAAIRSVSTTVHIFIPGPNSSINQFSGAYQAAWAGYVDPAGGPWSFSVHKYFDFDGTGTHSTCAVNPNPPDFDAWTTWARGQGFTASMTEFGWGTDASCTAQPNVQPGIPNYFTANADVYWGWNWFSGGAFPTTYVTFMGPLPGGGVPPQLASLTSNLGNTF